MPGRHGGEGEAAPPRCQSRIQRTLCCGRLPTYSPGRSGEGANLLESNGGQSSAGSGACLGDRSDLLSDEVFAEQLTRNIQFLGVKSQKKVAESFVVVIGLGGAGSHAASMLLRSGVGRLLLVDFGQVEPWKLKWNS